MGFIVNNAVEMLVPTPNASVNSMIGVYKSGQQMTLYIYGSVICHAGLQQ